jgi:hypothetical protein
MVNQCQLASNFRMFHVKTPLGFFQIGTSAKIPMGVRFYRYRLSVKSVPAVNNLFFVGACSAAYKWCYNLLTASGEGSKGRPGCIIRGCPCWSGNVPV